MREAERELVHLFAAGPDVSRGDAGAFQLIKHEREQDPMPGAALQVHVLSARAAGNEGGVSSL